MATLILAVDSRRAYGVEFNISGARCAIVVNRRRTPPERLAEELQAALQGIEATVASVGRGGSVKARSESTERGVGPFTSAAYSLPNPDLLMVTFGDGGAWTVADRAPNFGPFPVALIADIETPAWQDACTPASIAGAMQLLTSMMVPA